MASGPAPDVTRLLLSWSQGNQAALDELMPLVYDELRRLASASSGANGLTTPSRAQPWFTKLL